MGAQSGGGGSYDVRPPVLEAGAGWLAEDGEAIGTEGSAGAAAATAAAGACAPGPVVGALHAFAAELGARSGEMSAAVATAGQALAGNACVYWATDTGAAELLGR
ncbi:hypothetical protein [Vallicoccus soli]|uniref:PE domain-containing protein n=1 Tax=Vallicoccus soli TaxID=2339232 RepID=A0A3A3Z250_9ACTN|nr:hypothetical protein [Vallicoccus soli]RJK97524.1 hypothetical protein D5H78_00290 [Vallicoccus soli]